jgi:prophage antirepressor-like protein
MTIINESDLYRVITHSQLPAVQDFERWGRGEIYLIGTEN